MITRHSHERLMPVAGAACPERGSVILRRVAPVLLAFVLLCAFAVLALPTTASHPIRGLNYWPDSADYIYGAVALLHGSYVVSWAGLTPVHPVATWGLEPHIPRYTPGMSILLMPVVAVAGVTQAVWVPYALGLLLGVLVAGLAARLSGPGAAPLAVVAVLGTGTWVGLTQSIMSDVPSATLTVIEVLLLLRTKGRGAVVAAGIIAAAIVWIRPTNAVLLLAGMAALTAQAQPRRRLIAYVAGAVPLLALLALWQAYLFGSPLVNGYQATGATPSGDTMLGAFFSLRYIVGLPASTSNVLFGWQLPSLLYYPLALAGLNFSLALPGVGALGLAAAIGFTRRMGTLGALGRFSIVATLGTFLVYVPYFHQDPRFLIVPGVLLNLLAVVCIARRYPRLFGVWSAHTAPS